VDKQTDRQTDRQTNAGENLPHDCRWCR